MDKLGCLSNKSMRGMKIAELKELAKKMKIDLIRANARTKEQMIVVLEGVANGTWKYDDEIGGSYGQDK